MQEQIKTHKRNCFRHQKPIIGICRSHLCDHYKQLCIDCKRDHKHDKEYLGWQQAVKEAKQLGQIGLKSLNATRLRKNAEKQNYLKNNMAIVQIQTKLQQIKNIIIEKIQHFKDNIKAMYEYHVKVKLQDLEQIITKNQKLLNDQLKKIDQNLYRDLSKLFTRDLLYQFKFLDSHFNEIFIKKTRHFRSALQNDRIFTLIVNFQQNLEKIFTFNPQKTSPNHRQCHIFRKQRQFPVLYSLGKDGKTIEKKQLAKNTSQLIKINEGRQYQWKDVPESIFYKANNCYYILGEGSKQSRLIVKWEWIKGLDQSFSSVRSMETPRRNFAVCQLGGQIYIVGGQNDQQGCLSRCQKFVPLCGSMIYIIHSLNSRSSRHSLTTYKDKYILKFGGIKSLSLEGNPDEKAAPPEIYSIEAEEWWPINIKPDILSKFKLYPSIIKMQSKNSILILGGQNQRSTYEIFLDQSKGKITEVKLKMHKFKLKHRGQIFNSTIRVEEEENSCSFICLQYDDTVRLAQLKLYN